MKIVLALFALFSVCAANPLFWGWGYPAYNHYRYVPSFYHGARYYNPYTYGYRFKRDAEETEMPEDDLETERDERSADPLIPFHFSKATPWGVKSFGFGYGGPFYHRGYYGMGAYPYRPYRYSYRRPIWY